MLLLTCGGDDQRAYVGDAAADDGGVIFDGGAGQVVEPRLALSRPPPLPVAVLPLTVQLAGWSYRVVAVEGEATAEQSAAVDGGVPADRGVGQRGRAAAEGDQAAAVAGPRCCR